MNRVFLALGLIARTAIAQTPVESNAAYKHFWQVRNSTEGVSAAAEWVRVYEHQPADWRNVPPYLDVARLYVDQGRNLDTAPQLLDKALAEMDAPGGFTHHRVHTSAPLFRDDVRTLAAYIAVKLARYGLAHRLLDTVSATLNAEKSRQADEIPARDWEQLRFFYRDAMARLAIAESRPEDALALEHAILTNPENVAAPRLIEEHRALALSVWKGLGRTPAAFDSWLTGRP